MGYWVSAAFAALPSTFPAVTGATVVSGTPIPAVYVRAA
jgi:hypothetical protein